MDRTTEDYKISARDGHIGCSLFLDSTGPICTCEVSIDALDGAWNITSWFTKERFKSKGFGKKTMSRALAHCMEAYGRPEHIQYTWNGDNAYVLEWIEQRFDARCTCPVAVLKHYAGDDWSAHIYELDVNKFLAYFGLAQIHTPKNGGNNMNPAIERKKLDLDPARVSVLVPALQKAAAYQAEMIGKDAARIYEATIEQVKRDRLDGRTRLTAAQVEITCHALEHHAQDCAARKGMLAQLSMTRKQYGAMLAAGGPAEKEGKAMKLMGAQAGSGAADKVSVNVRPQLAIKEREAKLKAFLKECPVTIEYGCHTIYLGYREGQRYNDGCTVYESGTPEGSDGITVRVS